MSFLLGFVFYMVYRPFYRKIPELLLCVLLIINMEFFYLIPSYSGYYNYKTILIPLLILIPLELILRGRMKMGSGGVLAFLFFALLYLGIVISYSHGQSFSYGIKAIKFQLLWLSYFLVINQDIDIEKFSTFFILLCIGLVLVIFANIHIFNGRLISADMHERFMKERLGNLRFGMGAQFISIGCTLAITKYLKNRSGWNLFFSAILIFHLLFVAQSRMVVFGVIWAGMVMYMIISRLTAKKLITMAVLTCLMLPSVLIFGQAIKSFGLVKITIEDISKKKNNYTARVDAYAYYLGKIMASPIFGYGYENENWAGSPVKKLMEEGLFATDIGITEFFYNNGLIGLAWFLSVSLFVFKYCKTIRYSYPEVVCYFVLAYSTMVTLDYLFHPSKIFIFGLFFGLAVKSYSKLKMEKEINNGCLNCHSEF